MMFILYKRFEILNWKLKVFWNNHYENVQIQEFKCFLFHSKLIKIRYFLFLCLFLRFRWCVKMLSNYLKYFLKSFTFSCLHQLKINKKSITRKIVFGKKHHFKINKFFAKHRIQKKFKKIQQWYTLYISHLSPCIK